MALLTALALASSGGLVACGDDDDDSSGGGGGGGGGGLEGKTVGIIAPLANPFQTAMRNAAESVADKNGVDVIYLNTNLNTQKESAYVGDLINRKVDAVIFGAIDAKASLAGFKRLQAAGIPIVCFDTCIEDDLQQQYTEAFVTSNNGQLGTTSGEDAANWIKENVKGQKAKLAYVTCNTQSVCRNRWDAQVKALESAPHDVVADQVALESDAVKRTVEGILQANPDLDLIVTNGTPQTEGVTAAVSNMNKDVAIFGIDITEPIANALLDPNGPLESTLGQDGNALGTKMMEVTLEVLQGKKPSPFLSEIDGTIYSKDDPEKVEEYLASIK
jgi:simple sugar transport system substrate-binding protein